MLNSALLCALALAAMPPAEPPFAEPPHEDSLLQHQSTLIANRSREIRHGVDLAESAYSVAADSKPPEHEEQVESLWKAYIHTNDSSVPLLLPLLKQDPSTPVAFQTAEWILMNRRLRVPRLIPFGREAIQILRLHHVDNPKLARVCTNLGQRWPFNDPVATEFLEAVRKQNPDRETRGQAVLALARLAKAESSDRGSTSTDPASFRAMQLYRTVLRDYAECSYIAPRTGSPAARLCDIADREILELTSLAVGKPAPEIHGEDLEGKRFKLSDYRGKVVVLSFWATWCGPCMQLIPHERRLVQRLRGKPFALIGVNGDDDIKKVRAVLGRDRIVWRSFWDRGSNGPIGTAWNVRIWPTLYVIDCKGVIRFKDVYDKDLDRAVDQLLAEQP